MKIGAKGIMVYWHRVVLFLCLATFCSVAGADSIVFVNGDRLTGTIGQLVDGKLTFESELAGTLTINIANIATFSSDEAIDLHLEDGSILSEQVAASEPNHIAVGPGQRIEFRRIVSINPPPKAKPKWTGDISAGYTSTAGNTSTDAINFSGSMKKRTEKDRKTISGDFARGRQENPSTGKKTKTEDWWRTKAKYDYFFTKKMYGYLDGRYETDDIAQLDRRVILGTGAGYQWIESEAMNFSTEAGLAYMLEKYGNSTGSSDEISVQLGYNFDKKLGNGIEFIHDLTYYPSTKDFADYYLTSTAELRANFSKTMFTNLKAILNYDATPAQGQHSTDTKYIWGIGWSF
ncbi:MAG: DUF481 domain-containing protein [Sedimentisphaerales bacterium]|nr:DUF481 domain-containing protein [Sedimentisphaerales bacterium]